MVTLFKMDGTSHGHTSGFEVGPVSLNKSLRTLNPSDFVFWKHMYDNAFRVSGVFVAQQTRPSGNAKLLTLLLVPLSCHNG